MKRIPYTQFIQDPMVKYLPIGEIINGVPVDSVPVKVSGDKLEIYKVIVGIGGIYFELIKEVDLCMK